MAREMGIKNIFKSIASYYTRCQQQERGRKQEAIQKALQCKGWTDTLKLSLLFECIKRTERLSGDILEIGSAWGRSAVFFGYASRKRIWSIDPHTGGRAFLERGEEQNSFDEFCHNIKRHNLTHRINVLKYTTQDVRDLEIISPHVQFSLVFIDGLHTAEGVKIDLNFAYDRLVQSGMIVFDDYFEPTVPDYTEAIEQECQKKHITIMKEKSAGLVFFTKI